MADEPDEFELSLPCAAEDLEDWIREADREHAEEVMALGKGMEALDPELAAILQRSALAQMEPDGNG